MLDDNVSIEFIGKHFGLTRAQIRNLNLRSKLTNDNGVEATFGVLI